VAQVKRNGNPKTSKMWREDVGPSYGAGALVEICRETLILLFWLIQDLQRRSPRATIIAAWRNAPSLLLDNRGPLASFSRGNYRPAA